jgi:hypothetical protein
MISLRDPNDGDRVAAQARYITFDVATGVEVELARDAWADQVVALFAGAGGNTRGNPGRDGDILFLVHGFNVDHAAAKAFHLKCAGALEGQGWAGRLISYDWPSDGLVFAYLPDRAAARASASGLVASAIALLEQRRRAACSINIHVLAHSMGAFVAQQAFTWAYQDVPAGWKTGQLVLVAADVDHTVFSADNPSAKSFVQHTARLTAYTNRYDKALLVSNEKRLDLAPRLGRVGLPDDAPPTMCEVNCSDLFDTVYLGVIDDFSPVTTHCFYFDRPEFWRDLVLTLAGGIDRSVFPTREIDLTNPIVNRYALLPHGVGDATYATALARAGVTPSIRPV